MNIEIVWLAYDPRSVDQAWREWNVRQLYEKILRDDYRKRVDPRSMLFHQNQYFLLQDLELLMKRGASEFTVEGYLAHLFKRGLEELPLESGELLFDYRLMSYYTSLRMADDYHTVEPFFETILKQQKKIPASADWSLLQVQDIHTFFTDLKEVTVNDLVLLANASENSEMALQNYSKLLTNYVDFHRYTVNNKLELFYYNNQSDIRRWGNLRQRKEERAKRIVELTYGGATKSKKNTERPKPQWTTEESVVSKMRFKREIENLERGLSDIDPLIRQKAAEGLGTISNIASVPALIAALKDEEPQVRQEIVRALGEINDRRSVDPLISVVLEDESVNVIVSAAQSLTALGDTRGLEALVEVLLRGVYDLAIQIAFFPALARNKTAINMLIQAMEHPNELVRRQVAFILGEVPNKVAVDCLIKALSDEDSQVALNAAHSLGKLSRQRALPFLQEYRKQIQNLSDQFVVDEAIEKLTNSNSSASA